MDEKVWVIEYRFRAKIKYTPDPNRPYLKKDKTIDKWQRFFSGNEDPRGELALVHPPEPDRRTHHSPCVIETDLDTALKAAKTLKDRHPKRTFRIVNIHTNEIIMADIL